MSEGSNSFERAFDGFDLKAFLAGLPSLPGVYRFSTKQGQLLYVGKAKDRSIGSGNGVIMGKKNVGTSATASIGFREETGVGVCGEHHGCSVVSNAICGVGSDVVKELIDGPFCAGGGSSLL